MNLCREVCKSHKVRRLQGRIALFLVPRVNAYGFEIEYTDVMTGDRNKNCFLYYQLKMSMQKSGKIDKIVFFLMESGVRMILEDLKAALDRGVPVRILTRLF